MTSSADTPDAPDRDPLASGRIVGQNPATPERLPRHTRFHDRAPRRPRRPEEIAGVPAFLFATGDVLALTLDQAGADLPPVPDAEPWQLARYLSLTEDELSSLGVEATHVLRILAANGTFRWQRSG